ncbi:MAG: hypothetical protein FJ088_03925 [Deltaproteobacteria bacterium]|nr:hypothetical protein [Deltaproteobacteria bacterium]
MDEFIRSIGFAGTLVIGTLLFVVAPVAASAWELRRAILRRRKKRIIVNALFLALVVAGIAAAYSHDTTLASFFWLSAAFAIAQIAVNRKFWPTP